jgi:hypothetical protein
MRPNPTTTKHEISKAETKRLPFPKNQLAIAFGSSELDARRALLHQHNVDVIDLNCRAARIDSGVAPISALKPPRTVLDANRQNRIDLISLPP